MKYIALISDTHNFIDHKIIEFISPCDEIWHAGDIGNYVFLEKLESLKPVKAVYGNIDNHEIRSTIPEFQYFKCEDKQILITHIGGYPGRYEKKVTSFFKTKPVDIFISGHSHILKIVYDKKYDLLHLNPGAAGKSGFHKTRTALRFKINNADISNMEILEIKR